MTTDGNSPRWPSLVSATAEASRGAGDEDEEPVLEPEYGDLLDAQWLDRGSESLDPEDDLVDIGLTIDMTDSGELDESQAMELDVGALLTPLPAHDASEVGDPAERDVDGAAGLGALQDVLLPDEPGASGRDDDEVGNDERFPAFDGVSPPRPSGLLEDDAEGPHED